MLPIAISIIVGGGALAGFLNSHKKVAKVDKIKCQLNINLSTKCEIHKVRDYDGEFHDYLCIYATAPIMLMNKKYECLSCITYHRGKSNEYTEEYISIPMRVINAAIINGDHITHVVQA